MSLSPTSELKIRQAGDTESSWCRAVPGGTGITVLALLISKTPNIQFLENTLHKLLISHPILNSKLRFDSASNSFYFATPQTPHLKIQPFDLQSTAQILQSRTPDSPFHVILEHELNKNTWQNHDPSLDADVCFASLYTLENSRWVLAVRVHTSACDRTSATALLNEMLLGMEGGDGKEVEGNLGIEEYVPNGLNNKPFWARGVDMLGYSLNSLRLTNLGFKDTVSPRMSRVIRLHLSTDETARILSSCKRNEIKLSGVLGAAALMACHLISEFPSDEWRKYAILTLIDCRPLLHPPLTSHHIGFYHSGILHTHDFNGGEDLWELAKRIETSFKDAKNRNKHFSDMADLNLLMCKAIENPGLTPSASLRTSLVSIFEEPVMDHPNEQLRDIIGLVDYLGCASVHGVGPSMAIFNAIRDDELDCAWVFPFPLHSIEQMHHLIHEMKRILLT